MQNLLTGVLSTTRGVWNTVDTIGREHVSVVASDGTKAVTTNRGAVRWSVASTLRVGGATVSISGTLITLSMEVIVATYRIKVS